MESKKEDNDKVPQPQSGVDQFPYTCKYGHFIKGRKMKPENKEQLLKDIFSKNFIDLTYDAAFKYVFSKKENMEVILRDIVGKDISIKHIDSPEMPGTGIFSKAVRFDILCEDNDGSFFLVEMQKEPETNILNRLFIYGSYVINSQLTNGGSFDLFPVHVIAFADSRIKPYPEYIKRDKERTERHLVEPAKLEEYDRHLEEEIQQIEKESIMRYRMLDVTYHTPYTNDLYATHYSPFTNDLDITLCEVYKYKDAPAPSENASREEECLYFIKNLSNFAENPIWLPERYRGIAESARIKNIAPKDMTTYVRNKISQDELKSRMSALLDHERFEMSGKLRAAETEAEKLRTEKEVERAQKEEAQQYLVLCIRLLASRGSSPEDISDKTGLSLDQILSILQDDAS